MNLIKKEDLEVGKLYWITSKDGSCGIMARITRTYPGRFDIAWEKDGENIQFALNFRHYNFYILPDGFYVGVKELENTGVPFFVTGDRERNKFAAAVNLESGSTAGHYLHKEFEDIENPSETIEILGKTYKKEEVEKRLRELKPMEGTKNE